MDLAELDIDMPLLRWMSRLVDVARGRLALVGNPPLDGTTAAAMDPALVDQWLEAPAGLFGLAQLEWLRRGGRMDADDVAAAAALYTGSRSVTKDVGYVIRGLLLLLAPRNWKASNAELDGGCHGSDAMVVSRARD
jgi:hypothetical protein